MSDGFIRDCIEKLILLEQKTGADVQYRTMPLFSSISVDHLSIQKMAKEIATFVGLDAFTFIVALAKQKENVGGHIDLATRGSDVFIEIDESLTRFPSAVPAALCHEVCHKWLEQKGVSLPVERENEILTDITAVFLGFGKIMLEGCEVSNVRTENEVGGTRTITESIKAGYIDRSQFAVAYRLVCAMRGVALEDSVHGLGADSLRALKDCDESYGYHYAASFHDASIRERTLTHLEAERGRRV